MTDLREAAKAALWAFELHVQMTWPMDRSTAAIAALRAALAQEQAEPDAYGYASRLAAAIWEQHYKGEAPNWRPLDDLMGVLTQIDNMTAGLTRQGREQAEPTVKESLQIAPVSAVAENATTEQQVEHTPPSDYRRGYWAGFAIGKREGRIEAEDALAQQDAPQTLDEAMRLPRAMAQAYESGYKAGVAAEREACAQACERYELARSAAAAIRARGDQP